MTLPVLFQEKLTSIAERKRKRLIEITRELIRIPSENTPPTGAEAGCQRWLAQQLEKHGFETESYTPDEVDGITEHPHFHSGRELSNRSNLTARRKGVGGGRSLLLSGHIDTVPRGTQDWTRDPFGAEQEGNRIYGRGASDMKGGVAASLFVMECLADLHLPLKGDLIFETVVDEEFGGCTGTLAGRLRGYHADAAIITEPSNLRICPAQRGGRTVQLKLRGTRAGILDTKSGFPAGAIPQLSCVLNKLPEFAAQRRAKCVRHEMYAADPDPVPVSVTKVHTSPWGWNEPLTVPETALVEIYWQCMPGETQQAVEDEFLSWLDHLEKSNPDLFAYKPEVTFPIHWLPGSSILPSEPLVRELSACAETVMGQAPVVTGIEGPCDMFVFHDFGIPTVLWGPCGANIHAADEYVEVDSLFKAASVLLLFSAQWCGVAGDPQ